MTFNSRIDHRIIHLMEKSFSHMEQYDDDQDIYISERSSIGSSGDEVELPSPLPPLIQRGHTPSPILYYPQKQIYVQRYPPAEVTKNIFLPTAQVQLERKDEKPKKKNRHQQSKGAPGATGLAAISENKLSDFSSHHQHPISYGSYHRVKHPDRMVKHRPMADGQVKSHDSYDGPQNAALVTSQIKPSQTTRQGRREGAAANLHDSKYRLDPMDKGSPLNPIENEYQPSKISPRPSLAVGGHESDTGERRKGGVGVGQRRAKGKATTTNEWNDAHVQSFSNKSSHEGSSLIITSNSMIKRSKMPEKSPGRNEFDENNKHRHYPNHSPSIPSPGNHHAYQHIRRRPPSGVHNTSELPSVDLSPKKISERTSQVPANRDIFNSPPPPPPSSMMINNQTSYLPPISRDNYYPKAQIARFPNEYYGTLARQNQNKDWEESMEVPKIYRSDASTRFYDRYFTIVPDKRLAA